LSGHPELSGFDERVGEARLSLLRHVATCDACRARFLAQDPSRLFALLALESPPVEALDRLSARLRGTLDRVPAAAPARGRLYAALSVAAALLLAVLFGGYLLGPGSPVTPERVASTPGQEEPVLAERQDPGEIVDPAAALERFDREPVTGVELLDSPGSGQLVNVSVGEAQVAMIFDEALDI
jgi:hypothetical protein